MDRGGNEKKLVKVAKIQLISQFLPHEVACSCEYILLKKIIKNPLHEILILSGG